MAKKDEVLDEALALDVAEPVFIDGLQEVWIDAKTRGRVQFVPEDLSLLF
jgi:hypothetical protein